MPLIVRFQDPYSQLLYMQHPVAELLLIHDPDDPLASLRPPP
jgi:hypothetical protein